MPFATQTCCDIQSQYSTFTIQSNVIAFSISTISTCATWSSPAIRMYLRGWQRKNMEYVYTYHYTDVIMSSIASQITNLTIVYLTVYLDSDQRKHQSCASLAFVRGIHRRPVNSPHKWPVTRKMFPFDDVIIYFQMPASALFTKNIPC